MRSYTDRGFSEIPFTKYLDEQSDYRGKTPNKTDSGIRLITARNIKMGFINYECSKEFIAESDYDEVMSRGLPKCGDLLFTTEAPLGNVAIVDDKNIALAQRVIRFRTNSEKLNNVYALFVMTSDYFQDQIKILSQGLTVQGIKSSKLNQLKMFLPSIEEQHQIVSCLSNETLRIDNLISEKQNFIKLLQEKRQALISHVVTKGLNPNVPMKDSGVEWIGEIPEHWVAKKLKNCLSIKNGQDYKDVETENIEGSYPVYGSGGEFRRATDYLYDGESVLLGRKGTIDKPMYVNERFWTVDTMFYSKIHNNSDGKFLYYLATTLPFDFYQTKTALPSMTQGDLLNHPVAVPDKLEQIKIREYIDTQCEIFDELKAEVLKSVELLKEHRTALISAAVTGKIDVREMA
jgi:type I restriction enzyme, S subunit